MQIRQSTGQNKNVKRDSKKERTKRGYKHREKHRKTEGTKNRQEQNEFSLYAAAPLRNTLIHAHIMTYYEIIIEQFRKQIDR